MQEFYRFYEVAEKLGLTKNEAQDIAENDFKDFPFNVLKTGKSIYLISKKQVDVFLQYGKLPQKKGKKGRHKKWFDGQYVNYNFPVSLALDERFDRLINNINKSLPAPMTKGDYLRLAIEEFIQRRPEFMTEGGEIY